jgi:hypothetical protein
MQGQEDKARVNGRKTFMTTMKTIMTAITIMKGMVRYSSYKSSQSQIIIGVVVTHGKLGEVVRLYE